MITLLSMLDDLIREFYDDGFLALYDVRAVKKELEEHNAEDVRNVLIGWAEDKERDLSKNLVENDRCPLCGVRTDYKQHCPACGWSK